MSEHQLWNELGNIYINSGAFEQAIKAFDKAIEVDPEFGWAYNNMALAYMRLGEPEKSIPYYQRSIELLDDFSDKAIAWHRLGNSYQVMDDTKNAILAFQRSVDLDEDNTTYRDDLAVAMAEYVYEEDLYEDKAATEDVPLPPVEPEVTEINLDVTEEDAPTKKDFSSWLETTIEKLSNKSFEKTSAAFEDEPIVFPEGVAPEEVVAELMAAVENKAAEVESAVDKNVEAEPIVDIADETSDESDEGTDVVTQVETIEVEPAIETVGDTEVGIDDELVDEIETELKAVTQLEMDSEAKESDSSIEEEDEDTLDSLEIAQENVHPVPAAIAKDLIPLLDNIGDEELDASVNDLVNELSKEIALAGSGQVENNAEQVILSVLEDDEIESEELVDELEDDLLDDGDDEGEIEAVALEEDDDDEEEEDFEDIIDKIEDAEDVDGGDEDDRILFEYKKEEAATALLLAEELISDNGHNGNGNGNGKSPSMSTAKVWGELGNVFFSAGVFEGALVAYEKAIELDSEFGLALNNLALLHVRNGEYHRAVELYRKSIDLLEEETAQAISWNNLGNTYRALKEYGQAEQAYRKADELDTEQAALESWTRYGLLNTQHV